MTDRKNSAPPHLNPCSSIDSKLSPVQTYSDAIQSPEKPYTTRNIYKERYQKISQAVKVVFLSLKRRVIREDPACLQALQASVPLQEEEEACMKMDSVVVAHYIKKIYEKTVELRVEEKRKLIDDNEKSMLQYEPMLRKLEAESRNHIQREQQMKIVLANQLEMIEELKGGVIQGSDRSEVKEKEELYAKIIQGKENRIEELEGENLALQEQVRKLQAEMESFKAGLSGIAQIVRGLEGANQMEWGNNS